MFSAFSSKFPACVRFVGSFDELLSTRFENGINALCWPRQLLGNFTEVIAQLDLPKGITSLDETKLASLELPEAGSLAVRMMLDDLHRLRQEGLEPTLDGIHGYLHPQEEDYLRTDVCSFHADSATAEADTWLCTYHGDCSLGLPNDQAIARPQHPPARHDLLEKFGGNDDESFADWLGDHFHDLHYHPLPGAQPYAFGVGHLWRIATQYPGSPVPPCIHRAPDPVPGQPRLLLLS